jgi:hypothetical protein
MWNFAKAAWPVQVLVKRPQLDEEEKMREITINAVQLAGALEDHKKEGPVTWESNERNVGKRVRSGGQ